MPSIRDLENDQDMNKAIKKLINNKFIKNVILIGGSSALGQAIGILATPLLTRIYGSADFGILSVYSSLVSLFVVQASLNYEYAIPIAESDEDAANALGLTFFVLLVTLIISTLGFMVAKPWLAKNPKYTTLLPFLWLVPVGIYTGGFTNVLNFWAIRRKNYKKIAATKFNQGLSMSLSQIGLGFLKVGPIGLIIGNILSRTAGFSTLARAFLEKDKILLKSINREHILKIAKRYKDYPLMQTAGSFINNLGVQIFPLFLAANYGAKVAGLYYLTQKTISVPANYLASSVSNVFIGEVASLKAKDPAKLRRMFNKITLRMFLIGALPCLVLTIWGKEIFSVIFGSEWADAGTYIQVMVFSFLMKFASDSYINLALIEKQRLSLTWSIARLILVFGCVTASKAFGVSPFVSISLYTAAMVISYLMKYLFWTVSLNGMVRDFEKKEAAEGDSKG